MDSSAPSRLRRKAEKPSPWMRPKHVAMAYWIHAEPPRAVLVSPRRAVQMAVMLVATMVTGMRSSTHQRLA